jgi:hypothetical protein
MSALSLAAVRLLLQDPDVLALVGTDRDLGPWIADQKPFFIIENSQTVGIVINEADEWDAPNTYNSQQFPRLQVDIWADSSRNRDGSVAKRDADDKIARVQAAIEVHFHTKNLDVPPGAPAWWGPVGQMRMWGSAQQIQQRTGVPILGSSRQVGTLTSDIADVEAGRMRRLRYGLNTF